MEPLKLNLHRATWHWLDHTDPFESGSVMNAFAIDDTLCQLAGQQQNTGYVRGWVHRPTVVLGIQDTRLPSIQDGIAFLREQGYDVIARNSGGLAVVLDEGVYNLSLIFPEDKGLSIDRGYEQMVTLVRQLFPETGEAITDGEIPTSYCPGRYDLSIGGRKFAGISQRRIRGGIAVQIYLAIAGSGSKRADLIRAFYALAASGGEVKFHYPRIEPETMASLAELTGVTYSVDTVTSRVLTLLEELGDTLLPWTLDATTRPLFENHLKRMKKRNEDITR
ncbi:lipoate--protein ligase family protein [Salisediminibacterium beveridgei]|uniref:Octanoyl-[GcvH]:protein N-octanoyltransferase n=1 Tax=Salisediminibacterium beveridgei TaxID=632773 RepID=A0A1D7QR68_9BACI|nr:lipoate--protein ligase family protein [Salisediminibacterium beveridgei]AOM81511.1 Octanoyl-[GcvH]:protein N-octanoyltransferase [Salisediminibacterium beveridgei]